MNANNAVEQSAALIVCSAERAEALGVPRDRWVFPQAGTAGARHLRGVAPARPRLVGRHPAGGPRAVRPRRARASTRWPTSTCTRASRRRCRSRRQEIGLGLDRPLTVTGGLSFAGGPVEQLRVATRSRRWPACCGPTPAPSASSPPTAATSPSTPSGCTRPSRRPAGSGGPTCRTRSTRCPGASCARPSTTRWAGPPPSSRGSSSTAATARPSGCWPPRLLDDGRRAWAYADDDATVAEMRSGAEQIGRSVKVDADGHLHL